MFLVHKLYYRWVNSNCLLVFLLQHSLDRNSKEWEGTDRLERERKRMNTERERGWRGREKINEKKREEDKEEVKWGCGDGGCGRGSTIHAPAF